MGKTESELQTGQGNTRFRPPTYFLGGEIGSRRWHIAQMLGHLHDQIESRRVKQIMQQNTSFRWNDPSDTMGGFDRSQLTEIVGQVSQAVGITTTQASRIQVAFCDHTVLNTPTEKGRIELASMSYLTNEKGGIPQCTVIFNRSREVVDFVTLPKKDESNRGSAIYTYKEVPVDPSRVIRYWWESPWELIVGTLAEELKHAQVQLMAGSEEILDKWGNKYIGVLRERSFTASHPYDVELQEITAGRVALQVLASLSHSPDRSQYFKDLFDRSLETGQTIRPRFSPEVASATFIPTGFDLSQDRNT